MNRGQIELMIVAAIFLVGIAIIIYDKIKYRKHYESKGRFVFLRSNKKADRDFLRSCGINVCECTADESLPYLYATPDGKKVCAFDERRMPLIKKAEELNYTIVDCGQHRIAAFITEIHFLQNQANKKQCIPTPNERDYTNRHTTRTANWK